MSQLPTPTPQEFVQKRLKQMYARPKIWAITKESFILQLVLLAEFTYLDSPEDFQRTHSSRMCDSLTNPDDKLTEPFDDEWARQTVIAARRFILL